MCGIVSSFVQVMVVPGCTVILGGLVPVAVMWTVVEDGDTWPFKFENSEYPCNAAKPAMTNNKIPTNAAGLRDARGTANVCGAFAWG